MSENDAMAAKQAGPVGAPWWKGAHGEWLVAGQIALMALVFFGPRTLRGQPAWVFPFPGASSVIGGILMVAGGLFFMAAFVRLGPGLTPLPYPSEKGMLVQNGPYAIVRHPIYSGGLLFALGWALLVHGWLTLGYVLLLFLFLDRKSRWEERWLEERYPAYREYRSRVRRLVPFVY
jgi:protein-S-isoprenylcysteine O-methyltransferase Ste14